MGERHGQQTQHGQQRGHQDGAKPYQGTLHHRLKWAIPSGAELIEIAHHHHPVQDGLPEQRDEANGGRDAQVNTGEEERYNPSNQGEGHVH